MGDDDGCMANLVKYLLFTTNFLIFVLGLAVFGCGIWVLVDQPSFMNLFDEASQQIPDLNFDITLYTSAAWILIVVSALVVIISFFGCCGAIKKSKCMLGTYFTLILAMFIVMVVGAVLGYSGNLEETIKKPLKDALNKYDPDSDDQGMVAYRNAWDEVQKELKCCGIDDYTDWATVFADKPFNKPVGCCAINRNGDAISSADVEACQKSTDTDTYYFNGCYTSIENTITENQDIVVGVAIGVVVIMFLNMLFAFAMCTMVG